MSLIQLVKVYFVWAYAVCVVECCSICPGNKKNLLNKGNNAVTLLRDYESKTSIPSHLSEFSSQLLSLPGEQSAISARSSSSYVACIPFFPFHSLFPVKSFPLCFLIHYFSLTIFLSHLPHRQCKVCISIQDSQCETQSGLSRDLQHNFAVQSTLFSLCGGQIMHTGESKWKVLKNGSLMSFILSGMIHPSHRVVWKGKEEKSDNKC